MTHFKEGEAAELVEYFHCVPMLKVKIQLDPEGLVGRLMVYQALSSFGASPKEIRSTATDHIQNCQPCLVKYTSAVHDEAQVMGDEYEEMLEPYEEPPSNMLQICLESLDALNLL